MTPDVPKTSDMLHEWEGQPRRLLGDGRQACLEELTFGRGRICIGKQDDFGYQISF